MKCSKAGQFYGITNQTLHLDGVILNDADYLHDRVDWHFHENAYFTFLLQGSVLEGNKKEVHECAAGSLLFHNWQDAHYNVGSSELTRGFHVEVNPAWFAAYDINPDLVTGSLQVIDPAAKLLMYNLFREMKTGFPKQQIAIDALLIAVFQLLSKSAAGTARAKPGWVSRVREALHATPGKYQLIDLARLANVHPVHLSRDFSKYFHCTLGEYIRKIKIEHALTLLPDPHRSLTDVAIECDFADQSHFIRIFKHHQKITPLQYRRLFVKA